MLKKVVFIDPKGVNRGINNGIASLISVVKANGHEAFLIDFNNTNHKIDKYDGLISSADFIGISVKSSTWKNSLEIAEYCKSIMKETAVIVCGGPHATLDYKGVLNSDVFDFVFLGESENAIADFLNGAKPDSIKGIAYKNESGDIISNGLNIPENLDELLFPDFELFNRELLESYPLLTSRGCPYECTYCSVNKICGSRKWRSRSPESIIKEIRVNAIEKFHSREIIILDDNFTLNKKRTLNICELMAKEFPDIKWACPNGIRADRLDEETVSAMKKAGCAYVSIGVESLDESVFNSVKKGEKLQDIINAIKILKKYKIKVTGFFIIGLPGSSFEKDLITLRKSKKLKLDNALFGMFVPYPMTESYDTVCNDKNAIFLRSWEDGIHWGADPFSVYETKDYSEKQRVKAFYKANLAYYHYSVVTGENTAPISGFFKALILILKFDAANIHKHFFMLAFKIIVFFITIIFRKVALILWKKK